MNAFFLLLEIVTLLMNLTGNVVDFGVFYPDVFLQGVH